MQPRAQIRKKCGVLWISLALIAFRAPGVTGESPPANLTLAECLQKALQHNFEIQSQKIEWYVSKWNVRREWAQFEPVLAASARREERSRENTVEEERNQLTNFFEERNDLYDVGIEGLFFSGAKYRLGFTASELRNNLTNGTFRQEFESQYRTFLGAEVTQPLLRGAWLSANMAGVRIAGVQREKAFHGMRRKIMDIISQTEAAYWDLVFAQEEHKLREESVVNAKKVLEDNRARLAAGKMSEIEVFQAEAGLAERNTRRNETRHEIVQLVRRLNTLTAVPSRAGQPDPVAADAPRLLEPDLSFDSAMLAAERLQPDYLIREHELRESDIRLKFAHAQRRPQVDLVGKYGYSGLAGDSDGSWEDVSREDYPDWTVGVQASIGLGGDQQARSELVGARLRREQAALAMTNVTVEISNAIHASLLDLALEKESIGDHARMADFNRRLFDQELQKLDAGKSNSRQVLEAEQDMLDARVAETRGRNRYQRAALQLELASGTVLASRNLELIATTPASADKQAPATSARGEAPRKPRGAKAGEEAPLDVWTVERASDGATPATTTAEPDEALNQPVPR
jgi:outer membrane protein